jgi:hypothetical protein
VCCAFRIAACRQLLTSARCLLLLQVATLLMLPQKHTGESASCHVLLGLNDNWGVLLQQYLMQQECNRLPACTP